MPVKRGVRGNWKTTKFEPQKRRICTTCSSCARINVYSVRYDSRIAPFGWYQIWNLGPFRKSRGILSYLGCYFEVYTPISPIYWETLIPRPSVSIDCVSEERWTYPSLHRTLLRPFSVFTAMMHSLSSYDGHSRSWTPKTSTRRSRTYCTQGSQIPLIAVLHAYSVLYPCAVELKLRQLVFWAQSMILWAISEDSWFSTTRPWAKDCPRACAPWYLWHLSLICCHWKDSIQNIMEFLSVIGK